MGKLGHERKGFRGPSNWCLLLLKSIVAKEGKLRQAVGWALKVQL
jgi:hypothetical protein